ncbi:MAG: glycosyltransferase family 4 protein [Chloroflexota bacterium]|nr:glycosyltransferase family 4 protein [Chloroflexota bacterium]
MRILFLTNFYLPYGVGGEDQSCLQMVEGLNQRGHVTFVLTSMHGINNIPVEADGIYRALYLEMDLVPWRHSLTFFTQRKAREKRNLQCFERVLEQFKPDIIFIWGMWNLPQSLPALAEARHPDKVVYRFATYWPTLPSQHEFYWRALGRKWYSRIPKQGLGHIAMAMLAKGNQRPPLTFKHTICVSVATRNILLDAGIPVAKARVIHTGIDAKPYLNGQHKHRTVHDSQNLNLLYAGRLSAEKGVDTAIKAMEKLVFSHHQSGISLSVVGAGSADYETYLRNLVTQAGLNDYVSFNGHVPSEEMPELLQKFDVLLMPSIWPEPFARVLLEGMVSGLVVVATPTGGTTEVLTDGENGLLFDPDDSEDLAQKIVSLAADPKLRRRLALAGQQTVVERFTKTKMMNEVESYLQEIFQASSHEKAGQFERK